VPILPMLFGVFRPPKPDRKSGVAQWRDLRFLFRFSRRLLQAAGKLKFLDIYKDRRTNPHRERSTDLARLDLLRALMHITKV
jgi:hypothetical protein